MASAALADRFHRATLIGSTLLASWLGMQAIHELGHVVGAWLTGGRVERVVLHPLTISRTDVAENPHPLVVAWAGPVVGIVIPLVLWMGAVAARLSIEFLFRFFAGFCLLANGLYIGLGSFGDIGDCREMLLSGSQRWQLWLFGLFTTPLGLLLWNGLGNQFGLGRNPCPVSRANTYFVCAALVALVILGVIV